MYVSYLMCALFMVHFGFVVAVYRSDALNLTYAVPNSKGYKITTQTFEIGDKAGYIESEISAPVSNDWFEAVIEAVEEESGEEYEFDQGVEYYWGSDSDGARIHRRRNVAASKYLCDGTSQSRPKQFPWVRDWASGLCTKRFWRC